MLGSPTRALNELVSEERERVIELLAALTASSDLVQQQRCQISDLKDALQARVSSTFWSLCAVLSHVLFCRLCAGHIVCLFLPLYLCVHLAGTIAVRCLKLSRPQRGMNQQQYIHQQGLCSALIKSKFCQLMHFCLWSDLNDDSTVQTILQYCTRQKAPRHLKVLLSCHLYGPGMRCRFTSRLHSWTHLHCFCADRSHEDILSRSSSAVISRTPA